MPKCFRMSKHQIQLINRHQPSGRGVNPLSQNRLLQLEGSPSKYEYTFLAAKNGGPQRSSSNDVRVSFNDPNSGQFTAIARAKADLGLIDRKEGRGYNVKIELNNEQGERERMTPAFNARQSYVVKKEE